MAMRKYKSHLNKGGSSHPVTYKMWYKNCDTIIAEIEYVFERYESVMSADDKKALLMMLLKIEQSKKCIACSLKGDMYKTIRKMKGRYKVR